MFSLDDPGFRKIEPIYIIKILVQGGRVNQEMIIIYNNHNNNLIIGS